MPNNKESKETASGEEYALIPPQMTILCDAAIDEIRAEAFDLISKLGPAYDILRHPNTKTPMAIAVYGDWGVGKTSAMKWLRRMLEKWNKEGEAENKWIVRTVWFDPWKYQKREDVWRGLIAEVIIHCLDLKNLDSRNIVTRITSAAKQFGGFLGRGFLQALAGLEVTVGGKIGTGVGTEASAEAKMNFASLRDIYDEYKNVTQPEKAYLNEFESSLKSWLYDNLGKEERMVIFIDDLDRCLPEVALEVLEALKLYLNFDRIIFVIGIDRSVVDALIKKHYENLGVEGIKSQNYLNKMFQVEIDVTPSETQVNEFFKEQVKELNRLADGYWTRTLEENHRKILETILRNLSWANPREVKRMLNSALMYGAAAARLKTDSDDKKRFAQGVQVFLISKKLEYYYNVSGGWVSKIEGQDFFEKWSEIVRRKPDIKPPVDFGMKGKITEGEEYRDERILERRLFKSPYSCEGLDFTSIGEPYGVFCKKWAPRLGPKRLLDLLNDPDLLELMKIEFSREVASRMTGLTSEKMKTAIPKMPPGIAKPVARQLEKPVNALTPDDYSNLKELDLSDADIADISPLAALTNLERLTLFGPKVIDISPLAALTNLERLTLFGTKVIDISPLAALTKLQVLDLAATPVTNISPLRTLRNLQVLGIRGIQVSDISPLAALTKLQILYLQHTQVSDISPLSALTKLQTLFLFGTQVTDISPLKAIKNLKRLDLGKTVPKEQIEELKKALPELQVNLV